MCLDVKNCEDIPQVKCALWQAKQALLAFFRLGLEGSLDLALLEPLGASEEALLSVL
jgi:hypothetical protein